MAAAVQGPAHARSHTTMSVKRARNDDVQGADLPSLTDSPFRGVDASLPPPHIAPRQSTWLADNATRPRKITNIAALGPVDKAVTKRKLVNTWASFTTCLFSRALSSREAIADLSQQRIAETAVGPEDALRTYVTDLNPKLEDIERDVAGSLAAPLCKKTNALLPEGMALLGPVIKSLRDAAQDLDILWAKLKPKLDAQERLVDYPNMAVTGDLWDPRSARADFLILKQNRALKAFEYLSRDLNMCANQLGALEAGVEGADGIIRSAIDELGAAMRRCTLLTPRDDE